MGILPTETFASIRTAVARAVGAFEISGVVDGSITGTVFQSDELKIYASANRLVGKEVYFKSGTGNAIGNARRLSASATTGAVTTLVAWATNPIATDTFDIYNPEIADKEMLDLAIKYAIELAQDWHLLDWEDVSSLVLGSITKNGGFEDWANGAALAPDGFAIDANSTVARESTIILPPFRYSAKITTDGTNVGYLRQRNAELIYPYEFLAGDNLKLQAIVYCTTAARVDLRWTDDGSTWQEGTDHGGTGWETLTVDAAAIDDDPTELDCRLHVTAGAAVTAYVHDFRIIPTTVSIYEHYLPKKFARVGQIYRENGTDFQWNTIIPQNVWEIDRSRERLLFRPAFWTPPGEYRLRLRGQSYQPVPSADTDSIDLPVAYIIAAARSFLMSQGRLMVDLTQAGAIHAEALRLRRQLHRQPMASSRRVR